MSASEPESTLADGALTDTEKAAVLERVSFIFGEIETGLRNSSQWDRWNDVRAPVADMKDMIRDQIAKEVGMALGFDALFERRWRERRDRAVEQLARLMRPHGGHDPRREIAHIVERAMF